MRSKMALEYLKRRLETESSEALRLVGGVDVDVAEVDVCTGLVGCLVDLMLHRCILE